MAEKAPAPGKKAGAKKAAAPAKATARKRVGKDDSMECEVCGLAVVVEEVGGIAIRDESVLLCCGKPMRKKASKAKTAKTAKK